MNWKALAMTVVLVASVGVGVAPVAAAQQGDVAATQSNASATTGAFVSFETTDNAIVDYAVNGETVVENVTVQSESQAQSDSGLGSDFDLGADAGFTASGLDVSSSMSASGSAELTTESGATIQTYDNQRGELVVRSGGESQIAQLNVSSSSSAESEGDQRAVITTEDGTQAAVIATGDGQVAVTENGNVRATTGSNGNVVYRQYESGRSESDKAQEQLIANGTASASVYVQQAASAGESGGDEAQERTTNVVQYGQDTTVDVTQQSATKVNATVDRTQSEGRAVIVTVSDTAFENAENAEVYVDGEAAAQVDSYGEVRSATDGGDRPAYMIEQSSSAEATTDVVVGINHFSARDLSVVSPSDSSGDNGDTTTDSSDDGSGDSGGATTSSGGDSGNTGTQTSSGSGPGFGVSAALAALAGAALLAGRRL